MGRLIDLTGKTFGRWTVLRLLHTASRVPTRRVTMWECRCECGKERAVWAGDLRSGASQSCGHKTEEQRRVLSIQRTKHGHARPSFGSESSTYQIWRGMLARCLNPNSKDFPDYGGRGVGVCDRWRVSFAAFLEDMGERPEGLTLGRVDNAGSYEPSNCRWETWSQQNRNRRPFGTGRRSRERRLAA